METPHRSTFFFVAIYRSLDSVVNLMRESHLESNKFPGSGGERNDGAQGSGEVYGLCLFTFMLRVR